jgi:hypothetical protein
MRPECLIRTPEMADLIGAGLDRTVVSLRPFLSESRFGKNLPVTMLGHGVRLTISSLALSVASSAGAQGDLDQSKTATQLYASNCATCHESLASVRNTKSFSELKSFLGQHYTCNRESAANLAAYLKGIGRQSRRLSERTKEAVGRMSASSRRHERSNPNQRRAHLRRTYRGLPQTYQRHRRPRLRRKHPGQGGDKRKCGDQHCLTTALLSTSRMRLASSNCRFFSSAISFCSSQ